MFSSARTKTSITYSIQRHCTCPLCDGWVPKSAGAKKEQPWPASNRLEAPKQGSSSKQHEVLAHRSGRSSTVPVSTYIGAAGKARNRSPNHLIGLTLNDPSSKQQETGASGDQEQAAARETALSPTNQQQVQASPGQHGLGLVSQRSTGAPSGRQTLGTSGTAITPQT